MSHMYIQASWLDQNKLRRALIGSELQYVTPSKYHTSDDPAQYIQVHLSMQAGPSLPSANKSLSLHPSSLCYTSAFDYVTQPLSQ